MLCSVVIPMYNVERFIERCLDSVYSQGFFDSEFEVILVNDGSTDNSVGVAELHLKNKNNYKIISQKNKGLGGARNTGILAARGRYILFLDADDKILPAAVKSVLDVAEQNSLEILEFSAIGIDINDNSVYRVQNTTYSKVIDGITYYNSVRYLHSACNKLYLRDFLIQNKLFFLEHIFIEDFEFNTRTFSVAKRVLATDSLVCAFLQTDNSITRTTNKLRKRKMISDILLVLKETLKTQRSMIKNASTNRFFEERKAFLVATMFYQLVKVRASFAEVSALRKQLEKEDLFCVNYRIYDYRKNLFRLFVLKHIWLYRFIKPVLIYLK